jgi:hypothetical protein
MRKLTLFSLILLALFSCRNTGKDITHKDFLESQKLSAKEYVISLFKNHDIVMLCERHHNEVEQYNMIYDIVSDPYFVKNVGAVYTEVGTITIADRVGRFLARSGLDSAQINKQIVDIYRDADIDALFASHNFPWLLSKVYKLNQSVENKINVYPCDVAWDWHKCLTPDYMARVDSTDMEVRDSLMAMNFVYQFENVQKPRIGKKKALIIMNFRHSFTKDTHYTDSVMRHNAGRFLKERYKDDLASVLITGLGYPNNWQEYTVLQNGKWDYLFESTNKTDVGFNIGGTPFGKDTFDMVPLGWKADRLLYQDVFTGLVYYKKLDGHKIVTSYPGLMSKDFEPEFRRRWRIMDLSGGDEPDEKVIQEVIDFYYKVDTSRYYDLGKYRDQIDKYYESNLHFGK